MLLFLDPLQLAVIDVTSNANQLQKPIDVIGMALQKQYERWQPRARYKSTLDPTTEDVKKLCVSLRRNAKDERVLFHYNGHGVPRPTANGEIWCFNKVSWWVLYPFVINWYHQHPALTRHMWINENMLFVWL